MRVAIEYRPLGSLKLDPRNARQHPDAQIEQIATSVKKFGFVNPVLVREGNNVVAGEGRVLAARKLGLIEVPVIELHGLTEAQCRALALADNRIALNSSWDADLLASELEAMIAMGEVAPSDLGFAKDEIDGLLMAPPAADVRTVDTSPLDDRFWIAVRGPMKDQAAALAKMKQVMAEYPAIEVELGTTGVDV